MNETYWIRKNLHRTINRIVNMDISKTDRLNILEGFSLAFIPMSVELEWDCDSNNYNSIMNHYWKARREILSI